MNRFLFFNMLLFILTANIYSQSFLDKSANIQPTWLTEIPKGKYYYYFSGAASSTTSLDDAKEKATISVLSEIVMSNEVTIESEITLFDQETNDELISRVTNEIKLTGKSSTISGLKKEEEYWESKKVGNDLIYRYWILMKIPKEKYIGVDLSELELKSSYGITPTLKSAIVPGWGQIHKKENKKGIIIISGFASTLTAGIITHSISNNYAVDAQNADSGEWIDYYNSLSEQYYIASSISYILSAAIYGYNIYDAISSRGAKIYAFGGDKINISIIQPNVQTTQFLISIYL